MKSIGIFTGFSNAGINDAIQNALHNAGNPAHFEIVETVGTRDDKAYCQYHVTLKIITE